jgi:hypothetical protein
MKTFRLLLSLGFVLMLSGHVHAKAAYKNKTQMIETADVIAIVEITAIEKTTTKGGHWTYGQKATANVEKTLKGKVPKGIALYGEQDFICARCRFALGRYLVFLDRDGELFTGNNWQLSIRQISGDAVQKVEWLDDKHLFETKESHLSDVVKEIESVLAKIKKAEPQKKAA